MIKIATPNGIIEFKPASRISKRHWNRIEELCSTAHDPEELRFELSQELFYRYAKASFMDFSAFLCLESEDRETVVREWLEASKSRDEFEEIISGIEFNEDEKDEPAEKS